MRRLHRRKGSRGDRGSSWWICGAAESRASGVYGARIVRFCSPGARVRHELVWCCSSPAVSIVTAARRCSGVPLDPTERPRAKPAGGRHVKRARGAALDMAPHSALTSLDHACRLIGDELNASWPRQLARRNQHAPTLLCHQYHCWISRLSRDCEQRARRERGYNE